MTANQHESVDRYRRYGDHVAELARRFGVRLDVRPGFRPEYAVAGEVVLTGQPIVRIAPVTDETTYAVALHELGHALSPLGHVHYTEGSWSMRRFKVPTTLRDVRLQLDAERAAWDWAHAFALEWTPLMENIERLSFDSYVIVARRLGVKT